MDSNEYNIKHQNYGGYWLIGWCKHQQLPMVVLIHECNLIVATTVLFVAHKWGFLCTFSVMGSEPQL
jgi:hypothetical protein